MDATEYQRLAARTLINKIDFEITDKETMVIWNAFGLAGEVGELVNAIKKGIFHRHGLDKAKLQDEIGDVLWYVMGLCTALDMDVSSVMRENIEKLKKRYPNGYSSTDSINRKE